MQAIILNSGMGTRMGSLTEHKPKCLVEIYKGETILSRQVKALNKLGLEEIIITTGPFEEKVKDYLSSNFSGINFTFINNPDYEKTNYIYSLLLAREVIKEDLILMHGDMVFEDGIMEKLIESKDPDAVLVNETVELPEKDFKGRIKNGKIIKVAIDIFGEDCLFLLPIYKLGNVTMQRWLEEMELFKQRGELKVYAENALNNLLDDLALKPLYLSDMFCMEIDDTDDLAQAKSFFSGNGGTSHAF